MSERTGLDAMVLSTLECLDELGARHDRRHMKAARVADHLHQTRGTPPRFGYDVICTISAPWLMPVRLIDFHGNFGSPDSNDQPANARYTEVRLAHAGSMTLASERAELPRLPIGLINGDLAFGGTEPPFDPFRVADALRAAAGDASDAELNEMVGLPAFPTDCSVDGDLHAIASGAHTRLRLRAHIATEVGERGHRLVLSRLPFGIGAEDASVAIAARVDAARNARFAPEHHELREHLGLPLRDVRNESVGDVTRLVCDLLPDTDPDRCREQLLTVWPVATEFDVRLRTPLPVLLRQYAEGSAAQDEAMRALLDSRSLY